MNTSTARNTRARILYPIVLLLFFLSGALGLGYQVLWSKYLLNFIGISAYSYATVLAAFMGGLAIGSWYIGKFIDRAESPLKIYAYLELGIAAYALLYVPLSHQVAMLYASFVRFSPTGSGFAVASIFKVVCSGILLLPPTILMGGTYPALLKHASQSLGVVAKKASQLYAINAFGAVMGTLLMTFIAIPTIGLYASLLVLTTGNLLIGSVAFFLSAQRMDVFSEELEDNLSFDVEPLTERQIRLVMILLLLEGVFSFSLEIAWTRFFGVMLGSSTYSFSVMLAAFISGIAIGSAWLSRIEKRITNPFYFFGWTQLVIAALILLPLPLYPYIGWAFKQYGSVLSSTSAAFYLYEFGKLLLCFIVMLPATIFIGMAIPLALKAINQILNQIGEKTGRAYAMNTIGNVLGAFLTGLFFLSWLGMEWLLRLNAILFALSGLLAVIFFLPPAQTRRREVRLYGVALLFLLLYQPITGAWDPAWFSISAFRREREIKNFSQVKESLRHADILYFKDDPAANLIVRRSPAQNILTLFVNGKADASTSIDMLTQLLSAHLPLILHPQTQKVLIVGLASGVTAGAALKHPVQRVDAVDIVRRMPQATHFFLPWNGNPFADKRFHLIAEDGRNYISYAAEKYDVIISEPSNPWMAGTASLFSRDFYFRSLRTLQPDGVFVQWLQAYETSNETVAAIIRTFRMIFPYTYIFQSGSPDFILLGSRRPIQPDWHASNSRFEEPVIHENLKSVGVENFLQLLFSQCFSPAGADAIASYTDQENTDDNLFLEYRAPRDLFQSSYPAIFNAMDERLISSPSLFWVQYSKSFSESPDLLKILRLGVGLPNAAHALQLAYYYLNNDSMQNLNPEALALLPLSYISQPPLSESAFAEKVEGLLKSADSQKGISLLNSNTPALCLVSAVSPEHSKLWQTKSEEWSKLTLAPEVLKNILQFRVDICLATGDLGSAESVLKQLIGSGNPPPFLWSMLRASEINRVRLRAELLNAYRSHDDLTKVIQFITLPAPR